MTEEEIIARLKEAKADAGDVDISLTLKASGEIYCYLRKGRYGEPGEISLFGKGQDAAGCIAEALRQFHEIREQHDRAATERMALAIIRISHAFGSCTRSQLNQDFGPADVARLSDAAATLASEMAAGGPFSVIDDAVNANSEAA